MKLKTTDLQRLVNKVKLGVGNNNLVKRSNFVFVYARKGKLALLTTDGTNYIQAFAGIETDETVSAAVIADQFIPLVQKTTSAFVEMYQDGNTLHYKGNGDVKLSVADFDGIEYKPVEIPNDVPADAPYLGTLKSGYVSTLIRAMSATAESVAVPKYLDILLSADVWSTNAAVMYKGKGLGLLEELQIPTALARLVAIMDSADVDVEKIENQILFIGDDIRVWGNCSALELNATELSAIVDSPADKEYWVELSKAEIVESLSRLSIFSNTDSDLILNFTAGQLKMRLAGDSIIESVSYIKADGTNKDYTVILADFMKLIKNIDESNFKISYSSAPFLKFICTDYIFVQVAY